MKKYFIVSDLHLDDGSGEFTKSGNAPRFMKFLDMVGDDFLVILGDFLDFWSWKPSAILNGPHQGIIDRIRKNPNARLILGNHDLRPSLMAEIFGKENIFMRMEILGWRVFHGHQLDPSSDTLPERILAFICARVIQSLNFSLLNKLRDWVVSADRTNEPLVEALRNREGKYILGHSHVTVDLGWYMNAGSWLEENNCPYIVIQEDGEAHLKKLK
jgi:calcineurin-like phosphoesterase family protein